MALNNVSFSVKKGEFVLVIGSSGSGKSTLLNMIGLLDRPTEGRVLIDGFDTSDLTDNEISAFRNEKLGFVFQFSNLLADLTVLENVLLPSQIQFDSTTNNRAKKILEKVGLKDQLFKRANKISGGQAQRAAIARGLVNNPTIVLADEPTGNLDSVTAKNVVEIMKKMGDKIEAKKTAKKPSKKKSLDSTDDSGIVLIDDELEVDTEKELEERKAYLEEARSQDSGD